MINFAKIIIEIKILLFPIEIKKPTKVEVKLWSKDFKYHHLMQNWSEGTGIFDENGVKTLS